MSRSSPWREQGPVFDPQKSNGPEYAVAISDEQFRDDLASVDDRHRTPQWGVMDFIRIDSQKMVNGSEQVLDAVGITGRVTGILVAGTNDNSRLCTAPGKNNGLAL